MMHTDIIIAKMLPDHWNAVADIYKQGLESLVIGRK